MEDGNVLSLYSVTCHPHFTKEEGRAGPGLNVCKLMWAAPNKFSQPARLGVKIGGTGRAGPVRALNIGPIEWTTVNTQWGMALGGLTATEYWSKHRCTKKRKKHCVLNTSRISKTVALSLICWTFSSLTSSGSNCSRKIRRIIYITLKLWHILIIHQWTP